MARRSRAKRRPTLRMMAPANRYGRHTLDGAAEFFNDRRERRIASTRAHAFHRVKNGCRDPYSFFHVVDVLLNVEPQHDFTAADLVDHLNRHREQMAWDSITVGRILSDLKEAWEDANGSSPLDAKRSWDGTRYWIERTPEYTVVMGNLLDDLLVLCAEQAACEADGREPKRLASPLGRCPSVADIGG